MRCRSRVSTRSRAGAAALASCLPSPDESPSFVRQDLEAPFTSQSCSHGTRALSTKGQPVFELSRCQRRQKGKPAFGRLLFKRPVAAVALVPEPAVLFAAGAVAGALGTLIRSTKSTSPTGLSMLVAVPLTADAMYFISCFPLCLGMVGLTREADRQCAQSSRHTDSQS